MLRRAGGGIDTWGSFVHRGLIGVVKCAVDVGMVRPGKRVEGILGDSKRRALAALQLHLVLGDSCAARLLLLNCGLAQGFRAKELARVDGKSTCLIASCSLSFGLGLPLFLLCVLAILQQLRDTVLIGPLFEQLYKVFVIGLVGNFELEACGKMALGGNVGQEMGHIREIRPLWAEAALQRDGIGTENDRTGGIHSGLSLDWKRSIVHDGLKMGQKDEMTVNARKLL